MTVGGTGEYTLIEADRGFAELLDRLAGQDRYAIDTEFHRERTYFPHVALVQIADEHGVALVDALSVDLTPFARILDSDAVAVMHAARQDMEVLERSTGTVPRRLVDTQVAAGFLGYTSPSLATLLERELKVRALKADRLTDWLRRPLKPAQLDYAAADVAYLLELHDVLWERLVDRGRAQWVLDACEELRTEYRGPRDPADARRRINEHRPLRGGTQAGAQAVAGWRERRAIETDQTPRFVLSDLGVVSVASAAPTTIEELRSLRGVDGRSLRGGMGDDLLEVIAGSAGSRPQRAPAQTVPELPGELRPAVPLISAWVSQLARELDLET